MSNTGSVMCEVCSQVKNLGIYNEQGQHNEMAFVNGTVSACKSAKALLKKIDKHRDSAAHNTALQILSRRQSDQITTATRKADSLFIEQNEQKINATESVFRTAYECAKSHLSFAEHTRLLELQQLNGLKCVQMLTSENSLLCSHYFSHIG